MLTRVTLLFAVGAGWFGRAARVCRSLESLAFGRAFKAQQSTHAFGDCAPGQRSRGIESQGVRKAAVKVQPVGAPAADQYWEDGPQLTGWGDIVARYEDGTPAVVEGKVGSGFVVLSGIHPEAPESWRNGLAFATPASADNAYAAQLIEAALHGAPLPHD